MKKLDTILIGYNEIETIKNYNILKDISGGCAIFRDFKLGYLDVYGNPYSVGDVYNLLTKDKENNTDNLGNFHLGESFSAAISYLGTYLNKHNISFDFVNSFNYEKDYLTSLLKDNDVKTVAIITTLYVTPLPITEIVDFIRNINKNVKIIIGGPFVSTMVRSKPQDYIELLFIHSIKADYYINSSQGEATFVKLIKALKNNIDPSNINNLLLNKNKRLIITDISQEQNNLNINSVDWNLFRKRIGKFINVRTAISCPFKCSFCGFPERAGKYQTMSLEVLEKELDTIHEIGTVKSIFFLDDTFNVPKKRFKEILQLMIKKKYNFSWHSYFRCQYGDEEIINLMKESGCEGVFLGIESGSDKILSLMNKESRVKEYMKGINLLKKKDITTFGAFITGFPGENRDTFKETKNFIKSSGLDFFRSQIWFCEHITPIMERKDHFDIKGEGFDWSHSNCDSQMASEMVEELINSIDDPIWLPQYKFDFVSIWHLLHRGLDIEQIKQFLILFRNGIRNNLCENSPSNSYLLEEMDNLINGSVTNNKPVNSSLDVPFSF